MFGLVKSLLIVTLILIITGCAGSYGTLQQNAVDIKLKEIREDINDGDFTRALEVSEQHLRYRTGYVPKNELIRMLKTIPDYKIVIPEIYIDKSKGLKDRESVDNYETIRVITGILARNNLIDEDDADEIEEVLRSTLVENLDHFNIDQTRKIAIDHRSKFGEQIQSAASTRYRSLLISKMQSGDFEKHHLEDFLNILNTGSEAGEFYDAARKIIPNLQLNHADSLILKDIFPDELGDVPVLRIEVIAASKPNSADGVDATILFRSFSQKTIKYVRFSATPFNAVGDPVKSSIGGESRKNLRATGPYNFGSTNRNKVWKNTWYNPTIVCIQIDKISIDFMDGSTVDYAGETLARALSELGMNDCSYD